MPILKKVEIHFAKLIPEKPNKKFSTKRPTWEIQLRTTDRKVAAEWKALKLPINSVIPEEEDQKPYWTVMLKKKAFSPLGEPKPPVSVIDGSHRPVDPAIIGDGSVANVRIYQYEYTNTETGEKGLAAVLMEVQLTKIIVRKKRPFNPDEDFGDEETEIIASDDDTDEPDPATADTSLDDANY